MDKIKVFLDKYQGHGQRTGQNIWSDICFGGTPELFERLMKDIIHTKQDLEYEIKLTEFDYIDSKLEKEMVIEVEFGEFNGPITHGYVSESDERYTWYLNENEVDVMAASLLGLGHAYNHLHFDVQLKRSPIAVFCYLEE